MGTFCMGTKPREGRIEIEEKALMNDVFFGLFSDKL
jgi:hypothetical protein